MVVLENEPIIDKTLIGKILMRRGLIEEQQLKQALDNQRSDERLIGEILVNLGYLQEIDIVVALIIQCNLPYIAINKYEINEDVLGFVPEDFAREFHVIPMERVGSILSVVMADPLDRRIKERIEERSQLKVAPFIATQTEIDQAIDRWYTRQYE
ncbi:MAG: hypothetical protein KAJ18_10110 [Candidatus Omnitrophica bacterium]|nr:hypothetical protein [Candidatus Omnitrophota bacterium]